ncbi:MAG: tetratricopeptide repeat protein [Alphaproteobacteria bacterium]|nr:tetratricopeptide repeat protein [Alphaproteobacteria bacterium]
MATPQNQFWKQQILSDADLDKMFKAAFEAHEDGKLEDAELGYRRILQQDPEQPHALHLLGLIAYQTGHPEPAIQLISQAIALQGDISDFHNNIGEAYRTLGRYDEAINHYRRARALEPDAPGAPCNMGTALMAQGKIREAMEAFNDALRIKSDFAEAKAKLGTALIRLPEGDPDRDIEKGIELLRFAVRVNPRFVEGFINLGNALVETDQKEEALALYRQAVEIDPKDAAARYNLANLLLQEGDRLEGLAHMDQALALSPEDPDLRLSAGDAFAAAGIYKAAIVSYRLGLALAPNRSDIQLRLASALNKAGMKRLATDSYRAALALEPNRADIRLDIGASLLDIQRPEEALEIFDSLEAEKHGDPNLPNLKGIALQMTGRFEEAAEVFRHSIELHPDKTDPYLSLTADKNVRLSEPEVDALTALAADSAIEPSNRAAAYFALGRAASNQGHDDDAFRDFAAGNALMHEKVGQDASQIEERLAGVAEIFAEGFFEDRWAHGEGDERPVFVVGMPRSGTTLVERILDRHPDITGAGELEQMRQIELFMNLDLGTAQDYPKCVPQLDIANAHKQARTYLGRLDEIDPNAARIVDKMPDNFARIGLIALLFPNAKVIHVQRDPIDTCLSCFLQFFQETQVYMWDQRNIANFYRAYRRYMDHWQAVRPLEILDVQYEDLIADPETVSRRMIAHTGLDWDDRCLEPQKSDRPIRTASIWQARQPIYASSVKGWKRYEKQIGPMIETLGEFAATD